MKEDNEELYKLNLYYVRYCDGKALTFFRILGTTGIYLSALRYPVLFKDGFVFS
jgi:hypothetical protein